MFCIQCGAALPSGAKFCFKCGMPTVDEASANSLPPQNPVPNPKGINAQPAFNASAPQGCRPNNSASGNGYAQAPYPSGHVQYNANGAGPQNYACKKPPYNTAPQAPKKKSPVLPIMLIVLGILVFILCVVPKNTTKSDEAAVQEEEVTSEPTATDRPASGSAAVQDNDSDDEAAAEQADSDTEATHVFFIDLASAPSAYDGAIVETTFPVDMIGYDGTFYSDDSYDYRIEAETGDESYADQEDSIKYVTVMGKMTVDYDDVVFEDPVILYSGTGEPEDYTAELAEYTEIVKQAKIAERDEFIASATVETYDDLRRNPDSFKGAPLALTVYITEVEADGWLTNGTIHATYNGNEIAIYDYRELREPRLMAGDSLTVYVEGAGLTKVTTYVEGTGLFGSDVGADVVDEYEVPAFNLRYTDQDDTEKFAPDYSSDDSDYYYEKGRQLGEQLNEALGGR